MNFVIDALAFAGLVLLAATGLLMHFVLPPGSGRATLWNMTRHAWGEVHFILALVILGVLSLHLVVHWRWIVCVIKGRPDSKPGAGWRIGLALLALLALIAAAAAPFFASKTPPWHHQGAGRDWHGGR
ncbi:MAG: DUF4405 domain-containing protein [Kiritimatiellaeota bacterium]|nr:DUF4405 domain-containing protein [Kiritimatiellota bacterium]